MSFDANKVGDILQAIRNERGAEDYFFRNVESPEWFDVFEKEGYFKPENNPEPEIADSRVSFRQWKILPFLEKISSSFEQSPNNVLIDKIKKIIKDTSLYKTSSGEHVDNYFTWWSFSRILLNFPKESITEDIIELFPIYLESKFDNTPQASEILEKILPKFLNDKPTEQDIKKAEMIFNYVTVFHWKKDPIRSSFTNLDKNEGFSIIDSFWLSDALLNKGLASELGQRCSGETIRAFVKRFQNLLLIENLPLRRNYETSDKNMSVSVNYKNETEVELEIFVYEKNKESENTEGEAKLIENSKLISVQIYQGLDSFAAEGEKLLELKSVAESDLKAFLEEIYSNIFYDYSGIYLRKVGESYLGETRDIKNVFTKILIDLLQGKFATNKSITLNLMGELLNLRFPLLRRVLIHHISENWDECSDFFWTTIGEKDLREFFDDSNYKMELKDLLQKNLIHFGQEKKKFIKKIIDAGPILYMPKEHKERYLNLWKVRWYSILKDDDFFKTEYLALKELTNVSGEDYFNDGQVFEVNESQSPLEMKDLLSFTNSDLVNYFKGFKGSPFDSRKPSPAGLGDLFKRSVEENPEKYLKDLEPFNGAPYFYVSYLLDGFIGALKNKKILDWAKIIGYFKTYISVDDFWNEKYKCDDNHWGANHKWVVASYGRLLREGFSDDVEVPVPSEIYGLVKETLFLILNKLENEEVEERPDHLSYVLNSPKGKIITAYLDLYRQEYNGKFKAGVLEHEEWKNEYRTALDKFLTDGSVEAYTLFGEYLVNLFVIDEKWLKTKVEWVLSQNEKNWLLFMEGYLFRKIVYKDVFELMKPCFEKVLAMGSVKESIVKNTLGQIVVAYLNSFDLVLYQKLINDWKHANLFLLINFYYTERTADKNGERSKGAIELFGKAYEKYKSETQISLDAGRLLSEFTKLTIYFDSMDDEKGKWLEFCSKFINDGHILYLLLDELNRLKDKGANGNTAKIVGNVLLNLINVIDKTFKHDVVKEIVEYFYKTNDGSLKDIANRICHKSMKRGYSFLDEVYYFNKTETT